MIVLAYYSAVVGAAYWLGRYGAGYGIALFVVAVALHQIFADGPMSLLQGSCERYGPRASDC